MRDKRLLLLITVVSMVAGALGGCKGYPIEPKPATVEQEANTKIDKGDTEEKSDDKEDSLDLSPDQSNTDKDIDLIYFMGESNMSGFGGEASIAPMVSADAGVEFRAESDPNRFYPISEPFGENENHPGGLEDFPGAKKGSMVSSFVNEYHELTGRRVVAVSASMGSTDMDKWTSDEVMTDVKQRFDVTMSYLKDNGYEAGHIYVVWLQGESDGLKGAAEETYKEYLELFMKPLFKNGLEKVFIITPGRTIDYSDVYQNVINTQIDLCTKDDHYALATTVLPKVSTEFMTDQYQYNQHVLNYVGTEAAKAVAYYTENGVKKIVYDFKQGRYVVPKGVKEDSQEKEELVYPSELDIDVLY